MQMKQFRVTNTTIKPEKLVNGRDIRKVIERVGYSVQYFDSNNVLQVLPPGQSRLVQGLNDGLINFKDLGLIKIEELQSLTDVLQDHAAPVQKSSSRKKTTEVKNGKNTAGDKKIREGKKVS